MKKRILLLTLSLLSLDTFAAESAGASSIGKSQINLMPIPPFSQELSDNRAAATIFYFSGRHRSNTHEPKETVAERRKIVKELRAASASASAAAMKDAYVVNIVARASIPLPESFKQQLSGLRK